MDIIDGIIVFSKKFIKSPAMFVLILMIVFTIIINVGFQKTDNYKIGIYADLAYEDNKLFIENLKNLDSIFVFEYENEEDIEEKIKSGELFAGYIVDGKISDVGVSPSDEKIRVIKKENSVLIEIPNEIIYSELMDILMFENLKMELLNFDEVFEEKSLFDKYSDLKNSDETFKFEADEQKFSDTRNKSANINKFSVLIMILMGYYALLDLEKQSITGPFKYANSVGKRKIISGAIFSPIFISFLVSYIVLKMAGFDIDFIFNLKYANFVAIFMLVFYFVLRGHLLDFFPVYVFGNMALGNLFFNLDLGKLWMVKLLFQTSYYEIIKNMPNIFIFVMIAAIFLLQEIILRKKYFSEC